jgi:hypothetical protein
MERAPERDDAERLQKPLSVEWSHRAQWTFKATAAECFGACDKLHACFTRLCERATDLETSCWNMRPDMLCYVRCILLDELG